MNATRNKLLIIIITPCICNHFINHEWDSSIRKHHMHKECTQYLYLVQMRILSLNMRSKMSNIRIGRFAYFPSCERVKADETVESTGSPKPSLVHMWYVHTVHVMS